MPETWTIQSALEWTIGFLERKEDPNPRLSAQWLMSYATGLTRVQLYANYDKPLSQDERDVLRDAVRRRGQKEPLQYIVGEVGFRYITVSVGKNVLIPRPETEVLVSEALSALPAYSYLESKDAGEISEENRILVADIGTGSGCIACSIAHERPDVFVYATDVSPDAIALAAENVQKLGLSKRVGIIECNLGDGLPKEVMGKLQLIVSNPPYIPSALVEELDDEVKDFEPLLALDGGPDGLDVYRNLLAWAQCALAPGGALCVELHEECLDQASELAGNAGFVDTRIVFDLVGKPRILVATMPQ